MIDEGDFRQVLFLAPKESHHIGHCRLSHRAAIPFLTSEAFGFLIVIPKG